MGAEAATINLTAATVQESRKESTDIREMPLKRAVRGHTSRLHPGFQWMHGSFKASKVRRQIHVVTQPLGNSDAAFIFSNIQTLG